MTVHFTGELPADAGWKAEPRMRGRGAAASTLEASGPKSLVSAHVEGVWYMLKVSCVSYPGSHWDQDIF